MTNQHTDALREAIKQLQATNYLGMNDKSLATINKLLGDKA